VAAIDDATVDPRGFKSLRADKELLPLARCRQVPLRGRLAGGHQRHTGNDRLQFQGRGFYLTTVGRVQTPTLAVLVEREEKIRAFTPRGYWEVRARFGARAGEYPGRWFDPKFKRDDDAEQRAERLWTTAKAEAIVGRLPRQERHRERGVQAFGPTLPAAVRSHEPAARRKCPFCFPARMTLSLAQALYERHKVLTYPRTDSRALPEDYVGTVKKNARGACHQPGVCRFCAQILKQGWVRPNKRVFDNTRISDHFASSPPCRRPSN